jgi:hypothetical protein
MGYKFIENYSDFILNETLKTHDIDITLKNVNRELSLLGYNFSIRKDDNKILVSLKNVNTTHVFGLIINCLNQLMIDRHGWFPSSMFMISINGMKHESIYDENKLFKDQSFISEVEISYEPKYDIELILPNTLYHLSVQEFEKDVIKRGIIPKSKSKLSKHLDRIYLCDNESDCKKLIGRMKMFYMDKLSKNRRDKINSKWILYEIDSSNLDIKLYKDPNSSGYYCVDNIPADKIKIIDKE